MVYRCLAVLLLLGIIAVGSLSSPRPSWADTLVQQNVDTRVVLAFRVGQAALQSWLPAPWQVNPVATGPSKDANLLINLIDRVLNQDAEGKLVAGGYDRLVSVNMPAKHPETGKAGPFVMRIFTVNPQSIPGNDKTSVQASVCREQALKWVDLEPGVGSELWEDRETAANRVTTLWLIVIFGENWYLTGCIAHRPVLSSRVHPDVLSLGPWRSPRRCWASPAVG
jgi:hypothetical protein